MIAHRRVDYDHQVDSTINLILIIIIIIITTQVEELIGL